MINYSKDYENLLRQLSKLKVSPNSINKVLYGFWQQTDVYKFLKKQERDLNRDDESFSREQNLKRREEWYKTYMHAFRLFLSNVKNELAATDASNFELDNKSLKYMIDKSIDQLEKINFNYNKRPPVFNVKNKSQQVLSKKSHEELIKLWNKNNQKKNEQIKKTQNKKLINNISPKNVNKVNSDNNLHKKKNLINKISENNEEDFNFNIEDEDTIKNLHTKIFHNKNNWNNKNSSFRNIVENKSRFHENQSENKSFSFDSLKLLEKSIANDKKWENEYIQETEKRWKEIKKEKRIFTDKTPNFVKEIIKIKKANIPITDLIINENEKVIIHKTPDGVIIELYDNGKSSTEESYLIDLSDNDKIEIPIPIKIIRTREITEYEKQKNKIMSIDNRILVQRKK